MVTLSADNIDRTLKIDLDDGTAPSYEDALRRAATRRLDVGMGPDFGWDQAHQAFLQTALNIAPRAFPGGTSLHVEGRDRVFTTGWWAGHTVANVATYYGITPGESTNESVRLELGRELRSRESDSVQPWWDGWKGGFAGSSDDTVSSMPAMPLSGVLAAGLSIAECFRRSRGQPPNSAQAISLWAPDTHGMGDALPEPLELLLPTRLWVLGLGHLGQAYLWALGQLPYPEGERTLVLQDNDEFVAGNLATSVLATSSDVGQAKTRIAASRMEERGWTTRMVERRFTATTRPSGDEPQWLISGVDNPEARRHLGNFPVAFDAGIGKRPADYDDILIRSFPADTPASQAYPQRPPHLERPVPSVARHSLGHRPDGLGNCGAIQIAETAVGAAFVGVTAGAMLVAQVMRALLAGRACSVIAMDMSTGSCDAAMGPQGMINPGYVAVPLHRS